MTSRPYSAINKIEDEDDEQVAPLSSDTTSTPRVKLIPPKKCRPSSPQQGETASPQQGGAHVIGVEVASSGQDSNGASPQSALLPPSTAGTPPLSIGPATSSSAQGQSSGEPSPSPLSGKRSKSTAGSPPSSTGICAPSSELPAPSAEESTPSTDATFVEVENPQSALMKDDTLKSSSLILDKTPDTNLSKTATSLHEDLSPEGDNLEQSFAEQLSLDRTSASLVDRPTTPLSETPQKSLSFQADKLKKPSTFGRNPSFGKAVTAGLARRNLQNTEAEPASLNADQSYDDSTAKPSIVGTLTPTSNMLQPEHGFPDEQKGALLSTVEEEAGEGSLLEQTAAATISSSRTTQGEDCNASLASFMEEEMKAISEQLCQCPRFEFIMKEYRTLREKCAPMAMIGGDTSSGAHLEEEVARLRHELEAGKNGARGDASNQEKDSMCLKLQQQLVDLQEMYDKAAADAEEYKNRAKIAQKAIDDARKAMGDQLKAIKGESEAEIEKLKSDVEYHRGINISMQKVSSATEAALKRYKSTPIDELNEKVESGEKEIASLKAALISEQQLSNIRLVDMQQQKEAETDVLKGEIAALQTEMAGLKDELESCHGMLQKGKEAEALCEQYKVKIDALEEQVLESNTLAAGKDAELCRIQKAFREEVVPQFEEKIGELEKRLLEGDEAKKVNEQLMAQNSIIQKENLDLRAQFAEVEKLKDSFDREKAQLQGESSELKAQLSKAEEAYREVLAAKDVLQMENTSLNRLLASKLAEREQLQSSFEAESVKLNDEIRGLKGQLEASGTKLEEYKASNEKLQLYVTKGKKYLKEKDDLIESLTAAQNLLEMEKVEWIKLRDAKDSELAQLKHDFAQEKADLEAQVAQISHYRDKTIEENSLLRKKNSELYDQLDADAAERKGLAETVYNLQTKLSEYGNNGIEMRGTIDMAKSAPAKPSPSVDTLSYKSAEGEQKENDSSTMKDDNDAAEVKEALEEGGGEAQLNNDQQSAGQQPDKSSNMSCSTQ